MWALRAAVRAGLRPPRPPRGRPPPGPRQPPPSRLARALAALGPRGPGLQGAGGGARGPRVEGLRTRAGEEEAKEEQSDGDSEEEEEEEEEELLLREPLLPGGAQRVCVVHPEVKGTTRSPQRTRAEWQVAEAKALVHTLDGWSVVDTVVLPTRTPDSRLVFGRGSFEQLTERIRGSPEVTSVFLNMERMVPLTKKELEAAWGVQVFDRFTIVLHIFRCNARTKEARLQLALAEIPLLRSNLSQDASHRHRGGGSRYIMGSGESFMQLQQRLLREKETKIKKALEKLKKKRHVLRRQRRRRELPVLSVVGYTNCGKTTLIKALTGEATLQPRDQLFATLDVTAHGGLLPSRLAVLYVDTIGFLSQLPHSLIGSFSATLEDVACSDLIVHVRDVSHPETELQKASVLSALHSLQLPAPLLDSIVEVHNKVDLVPGYSPPEPKALAVSALLGQGLEQLKAELEAAVLRATGRQVLTLRIRLAGAQLSWLYREATVQDVSVVPEDGTAHVTVIISSSAYSKYRKLFPE